jgi:hypothetical protein
LLKDAADPKKDLKGFKSGSIAMSYFVESTKDLKLPNILYVFDSCFSGSIISELSTSISKPSGKPVVQFIASGSEKQMVPDDSIFRRRFVEGLSGEADADNDSVITGSELGNFLLETVSMYSFGTQTPAYGKMKGFEGDFVFFNDKPTQVAKADIKRADQVASSGSKEELLAIIKKNPHSPEAHKAMAQLRKIDSSVNKAPPLDKREHKVITLKASRYTKIEGTGGDYPYIVTKPIVVLTMDGEMKVVLKLKGKDKAGFKKMSERKGMIESVLKRRLKEESNLQLLETQSEIRDRIKQTANDSVEWVCPSCSDKDVSIAGLMGL